MSETLMKFNYAQEMPDNAMSEEASPASTSEPCRN